LLPFEILVRWAVFAAPESGTAPQLLPAES
jgi:hypothetical protein